MIKLSKAYQEVFNKTVYSKLFNHIFFFKSGKEIIVFTLDTKEIKFLSSERNLKIWIEQNFPNLFNFKKDTPKEDITKIKKNIFDIMIVDLQVRNQYSVLSYSRNPWSKEAVVIRDDHKLEYIAPEFYLKSFINRFDIEIENMNKIVEDYRQHFPQFDDLLDWLIANRFTSNRRTSYTYLRVNAGFGKSFLASIFEELGTGRKILQSQLKSNSASDLSPSDFRNSFILMIDEFTHFGQELKDLTHGMYLSAKYQLSEYVPLYAKVFMSAEKSTSFFGEAGVDGQLTDRVSIIDLNSGKLEDRQLYKQNTKLYHESLKMYVNSFFKDRADYYVSIGELKANFNANKILDKHFNKYRINSNNIEKIREKCVEILKDYLEWFYYSDDTNNYVGTIQRPRNTFFERLESIVVPKNKDEIITKDIVKMYELILSQADDQFQKSAKFKQTVLDEIFMVSLVKKPIKAHNNKSVRGILINLNRLDNMKIVVQIEDKNGNIEHIEELNYDNFTS